MSLSQNPGGENCWCRYYCTTAGTTSPSVLPAPFLEGSESTLSYSDGLGPVLQTLTEPVVITCGTKFISVFMK